MNDVQQISRSSIDCYHTEIKPGKERTQITQIKSLCESWRGHYDYFTRHMIAHELKLKTSTCAARVNYLLGNPKKNIKVFLETTLDENREKRRMKCPISGVSTEALRIKPLQADLFEVTH